MASSLSLLSSLLLISLLSLVVSAEMFPRYFPSKAIQEASGLSQYTVPLSNGTMDLPPPPAGTTLKVLSIGRGTQNYTCANASASSAPKSIGAVATLYDAAYLMAAVPPQNDARRLDDLPAQLLAYSRDTLSRSGLPVLGKHYFSAGAVPTFRMGAAAGGGMLAGKKVGNVTAPAGADPGINGSVRGAVDWLALSAVNGSMGLAQAYRVVTAGGKAPATCDGQPTSIEVEYAAQYWFFA